MLVEPIVTKLLAKEVLGIAVKPNESVLTPPGEVAAIVKPWDDEGENAKLAVAEFAINSTPLTDAVAYPFAWVMVPAVKYPALLFNYEILLPDTTSFFHSAMLL